MPRQRRLDADQAQQIQVVVNRVKSVILRHAAVDQERVEPSRMIVTMAQPRARADEPGDEAIMNAALRMRVKQNIIAFPPQTHQESERLKAAGGEQIVLMNP